MFLNDLRTICEQRNVPLISSETEKFLHRVVQEHRPSYILEVGSAFGYSSISLAGALSAWKGIVYTFEISYPSYIQCLDTIKHSGFHNIVAYFLDFSSVSLSKIITQKVDMIFIDAQKSQYLNYLVKIRELIADDGIIILDDIIKYQNKTKSLYEYLNKKQINYQIFETEYGDGLMIINARDLLVCE